MTLHIVTADERLATANSKTTVAIFGPPGVGKTSLLQSLLASATLCVDLEAGLKSVQDWPGDSIPIRSWLDAVDIACLISGVDPAADPSAFFSEGHYQHVAAAYPDLVQLIGSKRIIFVDSITELRLPRASCTTPSMPRPRMPRVSRSCVWPRSTPPSWSGPPASPGPSRPPRSASSPRSPSSPAD